LCGTGRPDYYEPPVSAAGTPMSGVMAEAYGRSEGVNLGLHLGIRY
jgi:hypothetical protein